MQENYVKTDYPQWVENNLKLKMMSGTTGNEILRGARHLKERFVRFFIDI